VKHVNEDIPSVVTKQAKVSMVMNNPGGFPQAAQETQE